MKILTLGRLTAGIYLCYYPGKEVSMINLALSVFSFLFLGLVVACIGTVLFLTLYGRNSVKQEKDNRKIRD